MLYVPRGLPDPPSPGFVDHAAEEIVRILGLSRGRAFVLFTSYANMNAVAERIAGRIDYPVFMQGEAPKAALLETFRETPHAVLLATASFWQGVDVAGEQLSCVVIDKLPFASPGDPVVAARINHSRYRTIEELYDLEQDPNCLTNRVDNPAYRNDLEQMRKRLGNWMKKTGDRALGCFAQGRSKTACQAFVRSLEKAHTPGNRTSIRL